MSDLVWSSDEGDLRRRRDEPPSRPHGGGRVKVRRETSGRRGKAVTTVSGVPLDDDGLRALAHASRSAAASAARRRTG